MQECQWRAMETVGRLSRAGAGPDQPHSALQRKGRSECARREGVSRWSAGKKPEMVRREIFHTASAMQKALLGESMK